MNKKFLQQILASCLGSVAGLFLFFALSTGGLIIFFIVLLFSSDQTPQIESQSTLVLNLGSQIKDSYTDGDLESLLSEEIIEKLTVRQITSAINQAAKDSKIVALFLDGNQGNMTTGYASLTEIRTALENFKKSGKKIFAYNTSAGEKDYFLTSIADENIINPMGFLEMNGLASSQLFFANALEKYGIGVQVLRVGKFKSAVEPFIRNNYSEESKEQTQKLLTDIWQSYLEEITKNNNLTIGEMNNIANNQGILPAQEAQNLKLINQADYYDTVTQKLQDITNTNNEDSYREVSIKKYLSANEFISNTKETIAILYLEGTIVTGEGNIGEVGSSRFIKQIKKIRENNDIKGLIVRINSPGGSALASELILRELQLTAQEKPIVISMGDVTASGGYWIATAGEKIFAHETTITGSIGVFGLLFNVENFTKNNGINNEVIKTNKFADIDNIFNPKNPAELEILQGSVNQIYDLFLAKVAKARNLSKEEVAKIAQGRVWSGEEAQKIGLVDEIGSLDSALQYLSEKLELGDKYKVEEYPEKRTWETELLAKLSGTNMSSNLTEKNKLAKLIWQLNSDLELQEILTNPRQVYTILPFKLNIE